MSDSENEIVDKIIEKKPQNGKKDKPDGRKKARTPAQIQATKKLVEATRLRREKAKENKEIKLKEKYGGNKPSLEKMRKQNKTKPKPVVESSSSESEQDEMPVKRKSKTKQSRFSQQPVVHHNYYTYYGHQPPPPQQPTPTPKVKEPPLEKEPVKESKKKPDKKELPTVRFV
jgi:hypothetical protein